MQGLEKYVGKCLLLVAMLLHMVANGQSIVKINLPTDLCADEVLDVSFGYGKGRSIVLSNGEHTLGHTETVFLPDGVPCDGSCSYRSPVTFTDFSDTAIIRTAQDIEYVRINMEHSYIGDIYINITCPNGQRADIMRFAGTGTSSCDNVIPSGSRQWLPGNNVDESNFFGQAKDTENSGDPCNRYASGNQPGVGWNYCWSNNTQLGYQYASGDGIVYRSGHAHNGRIDSSHVVAKKNFYHPDQSFSKLVGCPLNGTWFVEVVDGYSVDNGYIFEWELSLAPELLPVECLPETYEVVGNASTALNDSTFRLDTPKNVVRDTCVTYHFRVTTTCGTTLDTTATICFHPLTRAEVEDDVCEGDIYWVGNQPQQGAGTHVVHLQTEHGCDSLVLLTLTEHPSYDMHFYDTICTNQLLAFEGQSYGTAGDYPVRYQTVWWCDSVRTLHLHVTDTGLHARMLVVPLVMDLQDPTFTLRNQSVSAAQHVWHIGTLTSSDEELTIDYPLELDSLPIELIAISTNGCCDTTHEVARVDRVLVTLPNTFTPDLADNNRWRPYTRDVVDLEVWIYNRQGQTVTHWQGLDGEWDGTSAAGDRCPQGSYVYYIRYRTIIRPTWVLEKRGSILLIR